MYKSIYVPVDNSDHSNASIDLSIALGEAFGSKLVGSHVYAAKLHDVRFKQMEFTLPDEYKEEDELEKQRVIHDALIARGLHLISDSYLDKMAAVSEEKGIDFERKHFDGRNFEAIVGDILSSDYELVIMGALGQGAVRDSQVGSVCERVLRRTQVDTLIVRDADVAEWDTKGNIVVAHDGSRSAYGALQGALSLAEVTGKTVEIVTVVRPNRPEDQLLPLHAEVAKKLADDRGIKTVLTRLEGNVADVLLAHVQAQNPWVFALGRIGLDSDTNMDVGSTTEALVVRASCNLLVTSRTFDPTGNVEVTTEMRASAK